MKPKPRRLGWYIGACAVLAIAGAAAYRYWERPQAIRYTQLTDFTDTAVAPALSPNGRIVAFIRGGGGFLTSDQIWVKMLPNGEARRVTDDNRPKYGLAFSPDGSEIAYTVLEDSGFSTYEVSALGGEPHLLLSKPPDWCGWTSRVLFSERRTGIHLGVVKATVTRDDLRDVYFPAHERGMAHYSFPSPDRHWALVVEMDGNGEWAPCRLVTLDRGGPSRPVGPEGGCTSAGWSADGRWMYFTAEVKEQSHIWKQSFPDGTPEQITFGPTEEDGIAVEPGGHALITSAGVHESAVWIHDGGSERQLSSEGEVEQFPAPVFSPDASMLYYLLRRGGTLGVELWRTDVVSGKNEAVFPGVSIKEFDLSPDGKQAVYTTATPEGTTELWLAPVDRSSPAKKLKIVGARSPHFGAGARIYFQRAEGNRNFLEQIDTEELHPEKLLQVVEVQSVSPGRRWVITSVPNSTAQAIPLLAAVPLEGGICRQICASFCVPKWSVDGKFLFVPVEDPTRMGPGRSLAIPLGPDESLPELPSGGIPAMADASVVRGAKSVGRAGVVPGKDPDHYAWVNTTMHRNLYRISLP